MERHAISPQNMPFYFDILCVLKSPTGGWQHFADMHIRNERHFYARYVTCISVQGFHLECSRRNGWRNARNVLDQSASLKLPHNLTVVSLSFHQNRKREDFATK
jgi:hypothetical protein